MGRPHVLLASAAIAVTGLAVYLFLEVRATPAVASVPPPVPHPVAIVDEPGQPAPETPAKPAAMPRKADWTAAAPHVEEEPVARLGKGGIGSLRPFDLGRRKPKPDEEQDKDKANPKLDAYMDEVNKTYDRQDYDEALALATKALTKDPTNARMLRVAVSSSCILGDNADAQKYYAQLPPADRAQMKTRCARYGVTFTEPSASATPAN